MQIADTKLIHAINKRFDIFGETYMLKVCTVYHKGLYTPEMSRYTWGNTHRRICI